MPHLIHLHGPWDVEKINADEPRYLFKRRFGCPTNLEPTEKVFLVCELNEPLEKISLNENSIGEKIATAEIFRFDITARLQSRNELVIEVERGEENSPTITTSTQRIHWETVGSLVGIVRLEIEKT